MAKNLEPDYDPNSDELLRDVDGNPITEEYINQLNEEAEIGYDLDSLTPTRIGRPSLSVVGDSPQIRFRVSASTKKQAEAIAEHEGKSLSELAREALEEYLETHRAA